MTAGTVLLPAALYGRARKMLASSKIANYEPETVSRSCCGFRLLVSLEDPVAEEWYGRD
jgi:hypothetical protein